MLKKLILLLLLSFNLITRTIHGQNLNFQELDQINFSQLDDFNNLTQVKTPRGSRQKVQLVRVVDGDTVRLNINGQEEAVRLIGVDTPESVHRDKSRNSEYGDFASEFTKRLLSANQDNLYLELDVEERDRYGRILGYLWIDDLMVNECLVASGYAQIATYPPNTRYVDDFLAAQNRARNSEMGFWGDNYADAFHKLDQRTKEAEKFASSQEEVTSTISPEVSVDEPTEQAYIGNLNSKIFHSKNCSSVKQMKETNKINFSSRQEALDAGYRPCKRCHP